MHEVFEHTADLGLRIQAENVNKLFAEAAVALRELLVNTPVAEASQRQVRLTQPDRALLLFDWLNELLYLFDAEQFLVARAAVSVQHDTLEATLFGEPRDDARHQLEHEVKAITYHQLKCEPLPTGEWLAEVILDI